MPDSGQTAARTFALAAGLAPDFIKSIVDNRDRVIAAALQAPRDPSHALPNLLSPALDGLGERLVRMTCILAADENVHRGMKGAMDRVTGSGVESLVQPVQELVVQPLFSVIGVPDASLRAALITAHLGGLVATRYLLRMEPLASASEDEVAAWFGPVIQRLLDPTIPITD
jgi:hypothetical protein